MKLCLVRPPEAISLDSASANRPTLPLGLAYLAASARAAGHAVQVIDAVGLAPTTYTSFDRRVRCLGLEPDQIVARIDADVGLIGVGNMFSYNWPHLRGLLARIKARFPDVPLVLGGEAATATWQICLDETPIDAVALGEGEETLVELARLCGQPDWRGRLGGVAGIAWRDGGRAIQNPRRARILDVDAIPWPAWDLFDVESYASHGFENGLRHRDAPAVIPILATRGCPFQCTFCTSPNMWTTRYVTRDPKKVVDEVEHYVRSYGARNFPFQDLTAIVRKDWTLAFCEELIRRGLDITWQLPSGTRSEAIDDEVAARLARSGMLEMGYAPESGSDEMRKLIKKKVKRERLFESVRAATRHGIRVQVFFIVGFPKETRRDVRATLAMVARLAWMGVHDVGMNHYMALPGTEDSSELDRDWVARLGDDFYRIPLFGHTLRLEDWRKAHRRFSSLELTAYVVAGFALFYAILFLRHPRKLGSFLAGLSSPNDDSRLQAAIKTMQRNRAGSARSAAR